MKLIRVIWRIEKENHQVETDARVVGPQVETMPKGWQPYAHQLDPISINSSWYFIIPPQPGSISSCRPATKHHKALNHSSRDTTQQCRNSQLRHCGSFARQLATWSSSHTYVEPTFEMEPNLSQRWFKWNFLGCLLDIVVVVGYSWKSGWWNMTKHS